MLQWIMPLIIFPRTNSLHNDHNVETQHIFKYWIFLKIHCTEQNVDCTKRRKSHLFWFKSLWIYCSKTSELTLGSYLIGASDWCMNNFDSVLLPGELCVNWFPAVMTWVEVVKCQRFPNELVWKQTSVYSFGKYVCLLIDGVVILDV